MPRRRRIVANSTAHLYVVWGQRADSTWFPLYHYRDHQGLYARGVFAALVTAGRDTPLGLAHSEYVDYRLDSPAAP